MPITRIVVGRTTLKKRGSRKRFKLATCGKEKERWTASPVFTADGSRGKWWGLATFHGAKPTPGKKVRVPH